MRTILVILFFPLSHFVYSQELDIFQNDSIYARANVKVRTMYSMQGKEKQKELVTYYNSLGQKTKQYWYWNGEEKCHNVETFIYSESGRLTSLIDSFANGNIENTNYVYENNILKWQVTLNQQNDTCDFRVYPRQNVTIKIWYMQGNSYRIDTSVFEKENAKLEYYGTDYSDNTKWHYRFSNRFDPKGNLISVENPHVSFASYSYDKRNLLVKKQEKMQFSGSPAVETEYVFEYQ